MHLTPAGLARERSLAIGRRASQQCWGVTAGKARHSSTNVRGVTAGKMGRNSSNNNDKNDDLNYLRSLDAAVLLIITLFQQQSQVVITYETQYF